MRNFYSLRMLVVVLNDEETFTGLEGCTVMEVPGGYPEDHDIYEEGDGQLVAEFFPEAPYIDIDDEASDDSRCLVVLLNDGELFSPVRGCLVVDVPDDYAGSDPAADGTQLAEL